MVYFHLFVYFYSLLLRVGKFCEIGEVEKSDRDVGG